MTDLSFIPKWQTVLNTVQSKSQARISTELYDILVIIQRSIKESHYDERRIGDISTVLNMYVNWEQLKSDGIEASEFLQIQNKQAVNTVEKQLESFKAHRKILNIK